MQCAKMGGVMQLTCQPTRIQVEHFPSACQVLSRCNWTPMHCAAYLGAGFFLLLCGYACCVVSCCVVLEVMWTSFGVKILPKKKAMKHSILARWVAARPLAGLGVPGPNTSSDGYGGVLGSPRSSTNRWVTGVCCDMLWRWECPIVRVRKDDAGTLALPPHLRIFILPSFGWGVVNSDLTRVWWSFLDFHPKKAEVFWETPLHLASRHGHLAATELLLRVPEAITLAMLGWEDVLDQVMTWHFRRQVEKCPFLILSPFS